MLNEQKIVIPLENGYRLVAARTPDSDYDKEIYIGIEDQDGLWYQDLAIIRNAYEYGGSGEIEWIRDKFDVFVYADEQSEDYTNHFSVNRYVGGACDA